MFFTKIENSPSAVIVESPNQSAGYLPRIKIYFFLLSACAVKLLSTLHIATFLPNPSPLDNENLPCASNSTPYLEQEYLLGAVF